MGMGRRPDEGVAREAVVCVRLTESDVEVLDRVRGEQTRSNFIRSAIHESVKARA